MKKFKDKVRWEFKVATHGYGRNVREALIDSLESLRDGLDKETLEAIEEHETVSIDETDIYDEKWDI